MKSGPLIAQLHEVLGPVGRVHISENAGEVSVIVEKPVDIEAVDHALLEAVYAEPLDRFETADNWRIRLMKREGERSRNLKYHAVRVLDRYYEYRPRSLKGSST